MTDAASKRMRFQQATPFARAIGLELLDWGGGRASTRLAPSGPIARAAGETAIHPWALIGLADHTLSYVFPSVFPPSSGLSTLDLRVDFAAAPLGTVTAQAWLQQSTPHHGTAMLTATDAGGASVLAATALFNVRGFPGGGGGSRPDLPRFENDHDGPFPAFMGLQQEAGSVWLEGGGRRTVGFEGLPALHGGIVGALLAAACQETVSGNAAAAALRLTSLHIRFLRPAGLGRLHAAATVLRAGRSAAFLSATCWHTPGRIVADAQAIFAPPD